MKLLFNNDHHQNSIIDYCKQIFIIIISILLVSTTSTTTTTNTNNNNNNAKLTFERKIFTADAYPCRVHVDDHGRHGCYSPRGGVVAPTFDIFTKNDIINFLHLSKTTCETSYNNM